MICSITGYGAVSAAGIGAAAQLGEQLGGKASWTLDPETGLPIYPVGTLPRHPAIDAFVRTRNSDRCVELALHAAQEAVAAAGWQGNDFAVLVGCSRGPTTAWESAHRKFLRGEPVPPRTSPQTTLGSLGFALADFFGSRALSDGLSVTCSSGLHALLHGVGLLASGLADRVLVGGCEAPLTTFTLRQLEALRVYAPVPDSPNLPACRPLVNPPSGMVIGEGAAFVALERHDPRHRLSIQGMGASREVVSSATGITRDGAALQAAMRKAVKGATAPPDFIVAHAPGTPRGDSAERTAIQQVFGVNQPRVTSFKSVTGHTFGASGALGLVGGLRTLELAQPAHPLTSFLVNATGFGGNAVSVAVASGKER